MTRFGCCDFVSLSLVAIHTSTFYRYTIRKLEQKALIAIRMIRPLTFGLQKVESPVEQRTVA